MTRVLVKDSFSPRYLRLFGDTDYVAEDVENPDVILVRSSTVDTDVYPNLVAVARAGAGTNNITVGKATEKGICVFNTPGANANSVMELVFTMLGLYARKILPALCFTNNLHGDNASINEQVEKNKSQFVGFELAHKTLGVIGLGKIGMLVANAGVERGMKVVGYDAYPTFDNMHQLDKRVEVVKSMKEVLAPADILSVHVPLSDKTRGMIGTEEIDSMKNGCILMNYARNGIFNSYAVLNALNSKKAAIYITDFPDTMLKHQCVICTPHLGASTTESEENCASMAVKQLQDFLKYGIVSNSVNFPVSEMLPSQGAKIRLTVVTNDVPNMIATISAIIGNAGLNILGFDNKGNGKIGYNLIDLGEYVNSVIELIRQLPGVLRVRVIKF